MSPRRRILALLAALSAVLAVAVTPAAAGQGGGANNVVIARATPDESHVVEAKTQLARFGGDNLASSNIAFATASDCTGCHATAVAVQVVLVTGSPSVVAPANAAVAVNSNCTGCGAFAFAWQYVLETNGPVRLSDAAEEQIEQLEQRIEETARSILPSDTLTDPCFTPGGPPFSCQTRDDLLNAKLNDLTAQLKSAVDSGISAAGRDVESRSVRPDVEESGGS